MDTLFASLLVQSLDIHRHEGNTLSFNLLLLTIQHRAHGATVATEKAKGVGFKA